VAKLWVITCDHIIKGIVPWEAKFLNFLAGQRLDPII